MTDRKNLTKKQERFAYHVGGRKAFIGSRVVGHSEAIAHYVVARMEKSRVAVVAPTHRQITSVLMPRIEDLADLELYERNYRTELLDSNGNGVVALSSAENITLSDFDAVAIDNVDQVDLDVNSLADNCERQDVDIAVAGTPKVGPSRNISKTLLSGTWEVFHERMEDCDFVHTEQVSRMKDEFSDLQRMIEVEGMVLVDPDEM